MSDLERRGWMGGEPAPPASEVDYWEARAREEEQRAERLTAVAGRVAACEGLTPVDRWMAALACECQAERHRQEGRAYRQGRGRAQG